MKAQRNSTPYLISEIAGYGLHLIQDGKLFIPPPNKACSGRVGALPRPRGFSPESVVCPLAFFR